MVRLGCYGGVAWDFRGGADIRSNTSVCPTLYSITSNSNLCSIIFKQPYIHTAIAYTLW